jgi:hypothetical protein
VPFFADDRIRTESYRPPTVQWVEFVAATQHFRSQELPPFISLSDMPVPAELQPEMMHAFRFMTLLTPKFQPTGSLQLLTQQPPPPTERWSRDVWYIAKLAYRELFWRLNPETAPREEISEAFASYIKEPGKLSEAVDFFLALRDEGMTVQPSRQISVQTSSSKGPKLEASQERSSLSQLTFNIPLLNRRMAILQMPSDFGRTDLGSIEQMLALLRASLTDA